MQKKPDRWGGQILGLLISVNLILLSANRFGATVAICDLTHRLPQSVCSSCLAHTNGHPQDHRLTELLRLEGASSGHLVTGFVNEEGAANVSYLGFNKTFDTVSDNTLMDKLAKYGQECSVMD